MWGAGLGRGRRRARLQGLSEQLWQGAGRGAFAWRLDLPADSNDRGMFLPGSGAARMRQQRRLIHYISAGGMRQLRVRRGDRTAGENHERVWCAFTVGAVLWVVFRFVRCG